MDLRTVGSCRPSQRFSQPRRSGLPMTYVDGFVIPVPKKNLKAYRTMAKMGAKLWAEHGCLDYKECVADDLEPTLPGSKTSPMFPKMARLRKGETVVFSFIVFRNRKHRDQVNAKVMNDPRMAGMADVAMPFDMKRFAYAGFEAFVEAPRRRRK